MLGLRHECPHGELDNGSIEDDASLAAQGKDVISTNSEEDVSL